MWLSLLFSILLFSQVVKGWRGLQVSGRQLTKTRWLQASSNQYSNNNSKSGYYSNPNNYNPNSSSSSSSNSYNSYSRNTNNNNLDPNQSSADSVNTNNNYNNNNYNNKYNNNNNKYNNNYNKNQSTPATPNNFNNYNNYQKYNNYNNNNNVQQQQQQQQQPNVAPPTAATPSKPWQSRGYNSPPKTENPVGQAKMEQPVKPTEYRNSMSQLSRSEMPSRFDTCLMVVSGVIGTEPKDAYLANGHHVQSFAMAIVGHFGAVHEGEKYRPTETMWVNCEIWDLKPEPNKESPIRKGKQIHGIGYLLSNKWVDKNTGEEKKQFRVRISKLIETDTLYQFVDVIEDKGKIRGAVEIEHDSYFSTEFPSDEDQTMYSEVSAKDQVKEPKVEYTMMDDLNQPLDVWDNFARKTSTSDLANKSWKRQEVASTWDSLEDEVEESNMMLFSE